MRKKKTFKTNKIFLGTMAIALVIGGAIYFGFRESAQISRDSQIIELRNQLASLQEQIAPLIESTVTESTVPATSTAATSAPISEPEPEEEVNPCAYLNCDNLDGWTNSGSTFTCQDGSKTCTCQKQIYYDYSCSTLNQKCVYSTTNTRTYKYNCVASYPDLVVRSPSFSPAVPVEGDNMTFWATVKNQGEGSAVSSLSYVSIDGQKFAEFSTASLTSNESIVVTGSAVWPVTLGEHELEVCADGAKTLAESNEVNNCTKITFSVAGPIPDLIIESVDTAPDPLTAGQITSFAGAVKNQGGALAKPSITVLRLDLDNDGSWDLLPGGVSTKALVINESETEIWRDVWVSVAGTHKLEICADAASEPDFRIAELNETNNCLSKVLVVP